MQTYELGDLAIVTTMSGHEFVAEFIDASIDYIWYPVLGMGDWKGALRDPEIRIEPIGTRGDVTYTRRL